MTEYIELIKYSRVSGQFLSLPVTPNLNSNNIFLKEINLILLSTLQRHINDYHTHEATCEKLQVPLDDSKSDEQTKSGSEGKQVLNSITSQVADA